MVCNMSAICEMTTLLGLSDRLTQMLYLPLEDTDLLGDPFSDDDDFVVDLAHEFEYRK